MQPGHVKWFSAMKGFGFIVPDEGGPDIFVHHTVIAMDGYRTLKEGTAVTFEAVTGQRGHMATQVLLVESDG